jgi:hypothetical protein
VSVSHDTAGNFVIAFGRDPFVRFQRYASSGAELGVPTRVSSEAQTERFPAVRHDSSGGFVVAWQRYNGDGSSLGVFARPFASDGSPIAGELQVNQYTNANQYKASVAVGQSGQFLVVWESYAQDGSNAGIFLRRFASDGTALGDDFQVNHFTSYAQKVPRIASDRADNFVVVWHSLAQDGYLYGVFGRSFRLTTTVGPAPGGASKARTFRRD